MHHRDASLGNFLAVCIALLAGLLPGRLLAAVEFVPDPGFTLAGDLRHDGMVTITATAGGFGNRRFGQPWLWDTASQQYLAGEPQNATLELADGDELTHAVWTKTAQSGVMDRPCRYYTSRPKRHARMQASYGTVAASDEERNHKGVVGYPVWPFAGAQDNRTLYVSWWQKMKYGFFTPGRGGTGEDKVFRLSDSTGLGQGSNGWSLEGVWADADTGNPKAYHHLPSTTDWVRFEIHVDLDLRAYDAWYNGALWIGGYSGLGGEFEFRPNGEYLYVDRIPDVSLAFAGETGGEAWINLTPNMIGWDDGGTNTDSDGQELDICEIYVDLTLARVELSSQEAWQVNVPGTPMHREIQGRLLDWRDDRIEIRLNQGAFESLAGTWLYVVRADGSALRIGGFREVSTTGRTIAMDHVGPVTGWLIDPPADPDPTVTDCSVFTDLSADSDHLLLPLVGTERAN